MTSSNLGNSAAGPFARRPPLAGARPPSEHALPPRPRPPLTLILGPAGAGKTRWALSHFAAAPGRSLMVVSSPDQASTRLQQLTARTGLPETALRGSLFSFHGLISELVKPVRMDGFAPIGRTFQRLILADLFQAGIRADDFFGPMRSAPGFVPALAERIREWKLACLTPDLLEAGARAAGPRLEDPAFLLKAQELARLFRAYEDFLARNRLRDDEDCLHLAIAQAENERFPLPGEAAVLIVDGFYRFNPAQRRLLQAIAARGLERAGHEVEVGVTLPYDPERPLLFAAPERTLRTLRAEFDTAERFLASPAAERPPLLHALSRLLFAPAGPESAPFPSSEGDADPVRSQPASPSGSELRIFDAPNPYVEAEMVARDFRRLYARGGVAWSDFAVILRGLGDYAPILAAVFERYEIPLGVDGPERLAENPLLKTLLHLLAILRWRWRREDVLAFLKSSYSAPDKLEADALRRRARKAGIREGRGPWLRLVEHDSARLPTVAGLLREIARFDTDLTGGQAEPYTFVEKIEQMVTAFGLVERLSEGEPTRAERDRIALKEGLEILRSLARMAGFAGRTQITFAEFHDELLAVWNTATSLASPEGDLVRVAEPYDARERPLKVAAVMGLTERVFPRRVTEDAFLRDEERAALRDAGLDLEEQRGRSDDERFLFYLAVTAPAEHLILSYPRSSDEADALPSFYLDEVRAVCHGRGFPGAAPTLVSRTLADVAPRVEEVVSFGDRLLAACADLFDPGADVERGEQVGRLQRAATLLQSCLADPTEAAAVRAVVGSRGLPRLPSIVDARLRTEFTRIDRTFSVTELETYRRCPFQYFLRHVLRLHPEAEGTNPGVQGALLHTVLRRYYREKRQSPPADGVDGKTGAPPEPLRGPDDVATMRLELRRHLTETLEQERLDATPHRLRMTQRMLADALDAFAERETRFGLQFAMTPSHFELAFGLSADRRTQIADDDRRFDGDTEGDADPALYDAESSVLPLVLTSSDGADVRICGSIDRVDFDTTGRRALALDYQMERPPDFAEIQRGASLQMPLYLLALERVFDKVGAVGCYDSMRERGRRRFFRPEHVNMRQFAPVIPLDDGRNVTPLNRDQFKALTETAEATAIQAARAIATGKIEATPGDHCRFCAYADVCRTTLAGGHDGECIPLSPHRPASGPVGRQQEGP